MSLYGEAVYGVDSYEAEGDPDPATVQFTGGHMIKIERFFQIMFADPNISNEELRDYTEDHLAKLISHNASGPYAGQFAAMIAETQPKFDAFVASISTEDSAGATREGQTLTKDAALKAFIELVRKREPRIEGIFGKPSAAYEEFFPQGLNEYGKPTQAQAVVLMDRMVAKATKYVADVGQPMVDEFTAARTAFTTARTAQVTQKGEVGEAAAQRRLARAAVELQDQKNLLTIALMFLGQPERAKDFFTESKLRDPKKHKEEPPPAPPAG